MDTVDPRPNQMKELISKVPKGVPIVMLNMLRFRETAKYPDGRSELTGRDAYAIYSKEAFKHVKQCGGEVIWFGDAQGAAIGPPGESWDQIFLVRYPSIDMFIEMVNSASYQDIVVHRTSALKDSRLIATIESGK